MSRKPTKIGEKKKKRMKMIKSQENVFRCVCV